MAEKKEFQCSYEDLGETFFETGKELGLTFPDAYLHGDTMAALAKAWKRKAGMAFCQLPFCHTLEGEAMGGAVRYGNGKAEPRAGEPVCRMPEELLSLPRIDFTKGRIHEALLACKSLKEQGEYVAFQIAGPFTIWNVLMDAGNLFRAVRKRPDIMEQAFLKVEGEILRLMEEAVGHGAELISYGDPLGGADILGPKIAGQVTEDFTYGLLKKAEAAIGSRAMVLLCPKTAYGLLRMEKADLIDRKLPEPATYGEACLAMLGKAQFTGQMCMRRAGKPLEGGLFQSISLR